VPTRLVNQPEAIHGFISLPTMSADAAQALATIVATLSSDRAAASPGTSPASWRAGRSSA
jgi:hypothetical protein